MLDIGCVLGWGMLDEASISRHRLRNSPYRLAGNYQAGGGLTGSRWRDYFGFCEASSVLKELDPASLTLDAVEAVGSTGS